MELPPWEEPKVSQVPVDELDVDELPNGLGASGANGNAPGIGNV